MILAKFTLVDVNVFSCCSKLQYLRCHIIIAADMQKNLRKIELAKKQTKKKPYLDVFSPLYSQPMLCGTLCIFRRGQKSDCIRGWSKPGWVCGQ